MIYSGPGFLSVVWFDSYPSPSCPPPPVNKLNRRNTGRLRKRDNLLAGGEVWGEEPNHTIARKSGPLQIIQNYPSEKFREKVQYRTRT